MKFGPLSNETYKKILRFYLVMGSILLIIIFILYTNNYMQKRHLEAQTVPCLYGEYVHFKIEKKSDSGLCDYVEENIIGKIDYPVIVTDAEGKPLSWKNIGVLNNTDYNSLPESDREIIREKLCELKSKNNEVILTPVNDKSKIIGYVYYRESGDIELFKIVRYIELTVVFIFILIAFYISSLIKKIEKNNIFISLVKETSHQLGTPIASLIAWIELLRLKEPVPETVKVLDFMKTDVELLQKISNRFGKIGSKIKLKEEDLLQVIESVILYFDNRLPRMNNKIKIHLISKLKNNKIIMEKELIAWTLENIIKNAIDAMVEKGGDIIVLVFQSKDTVYIHVKDEGKGIPKSEFHKIFEPGETSKKRGWGLGLSLAKRIAEDYHKGKIKVLESNAGEGTTIEIALPVLKNIPGSDNLDIEV
ncbi:MAG: hypothetical protein CSB55_04590 [Candidatus Cloacimonadota bacterium]|nr:MAG: hypothetical protein CSB55_04590 [Candidatus Cloacimonadota bacterium]